MTSTTSGQKPSLTHALLLTVAMAAVILSALGFQYIGGYIPCALCLLQRWPYYIGVPIALLAVISSALGLPPAVTRTLFALAGIAMLIGAGLGVYHAGVEWKFWEGPASCSTSVNAVTQNAGNLLDDLNTQHGPSCTDATLRVLGLSFAGWNVICSLMLAAIGFRGAAKG
jgi:disulfide bond formation protein DsbB